NNDWTKIKKEIGLYRYEPSGVYFATVRHGGKLYRRSLGTDDLQLAKNRLRDFKRDLERTDQSKSNTSLAALLDDYEATLTLKDETLRGKRTVMEKLKQTLYGAATMPLRMLKPSTIEAWLAKHYGHKSASHYNTAFTVIRQALDLAVRDRIITENPAASI